MMPYNTVPKAVVFIAEDVIIASTECTPVNYRDWQLRIKVRTPWLAYTEKVCATVKVAAEFLFIMNYFLQPVALKTVGAESTGASFVEVSLRVYQVGSFMLKGDHINALPSQVVAWYKF